MLDDTTPLIEPYGLSGVIGLLEHSSTGPTIMVFG